jgi:hypothetical protein
MDRGKRAIDGVYRTGYYSLRFPESPGNPRLGPDMNASFRLPADAVAWPRSRWPLPPPVLPSGRAGIPASTVLSVFAMALALGSANAAEPNRESGFGFDPGHAYFQLGHEINPDPGVSYSYGPYQDDQIAFQGLVPMHYGNLEARLGLAGWMHLSYFNEGEEKNFGGGSYRTGGLAISHLSVRYRIGGPGAASAIEAGILQINDNPDASLFGDYLIRYGAYPGYPERFGRDWDSIGAMSTQARALRFTDGALRDPLRTDMLVFLDSSWYGEGTDVSLAAFLSGSLTNGIDWGAGAELFRFVSTRSQGLAPRTLYNGYVRTDSGYVLLRSILGDTVPRPHEDTGFYDRSAFMFSIRASADTRILLGGDSSDRVGGRIFMEAALLGWKNQPIFYEDRMNRIAVMLGADLPAFGLLDRITVQWERHPSGHTLYQDSTLAWKTWTPATSDWSYGAIAKKSLTRWLALEGRVLFEPVWQDAPFYLLGMPIGYDPNGSSPVPKGTHESHYMLRLTARL